MRAPVARAEAPALAEVQTEGAGSPRSCCLGGICAGRASPRASAGSDPAGARGHRTAHLRIPHGSLQSEGLSSPHPAGNGARLAQRLPLLPARHSREAAC